MTKTAEKTATPKATKADQIAVLLERTDYTRSALQRMTLAALTALVEELPKPEPKRTAERQTIGAVTVRAGRVAYWLTIGDREVGYFRRDDLDTVRAMREEDTKVGRSLTTFPALKNAALRTADLDAIRPVLDSL